MGGNNVRCVEGVWSGLKVAECLEVIFPKCNYSVKVNEEVGRNFRNVHGCVMLLWLFNPFLKGNVRDIKERLYNVGARL